MRIRRRPADARETAQQQALLRTVAPLSEAELALLPPAEQWSLPSGAVFLRAGESASYVATVLSGALREYFPLVDGTERIKGFNLAGQFAGSLSDLLSGEAARATVVAAQPSVLLVNRWRDYQRAVEHSPAWARFAQRIAEGLYISKVQREYELLALDAASRYRLALERWPQLEQLFSQRDIASYVGITPVHLSRLRAAGRREKAGPAPGKPPAPPQKVRARRA